MKPTIRARFWVEAGLASLCGFLGVLSFFWQDWIEALTGFDPDRHDGSFEWMIVVGLLLVCVLLALAARAEWRRPRPAVAARI
jgi:DMSO/TMAO reductase YedYZ heme-binding membrane subunit